MAFYGRIKSRRLPPSRVHLIEEFFPRVSFGSEEEEIVPADLFPQKAKIFLEIGYGAGEHLLSMAKENPDAGFLGVEPFLNGVGKVLSALKEANLSNILLSRTDGAVILERLAPDSIDCCFLLFPDPWNKRAHFKRRFVNEKNCKEIYRVLKPDGNFFTATDHQGYANHIETVLTSSELSLQVCPKGHLAGNFTRYEAKAISTGKKVQYFKATKQVRR